MDSWEFWTDTLEGFAEADKSDALAAAFAQNDYENYRITVHSIKSAAKTIGADALSEQARALEFAARDGDYGFISAHHAELFEAYQALLRAIERILKHE